MLEPEWGLRIFIGYLIVSLISTLVMIVGQLTTNNINWLIGWGWFEASFTIIATIVIVIVEIISEIRYNKK